MLLKPLPPMVQEILDKNIRDFHSGKSEEAQNMDRERFTEKYWEGHATAVEESVLDGNAEAAFVTMMVGKLVANHMLSKPNQTIVSCLTKIGISEEDALQLQTSLLTKAYIDGTLLMFYMKQGITNQDELLEKLIKPK